MSDQAGVRVALIGATVLLATSVSCWGDKHQPAWADTLSGLTAQMTKAETAEALTASWMFNLATINLLAVIAEKADLLDHVEPLMDSAIEIYGEGVDLPEGVGDSMLEALQDVLKKSIQQERQRTNNAISN